MKSSLLPQTGQRWPPIASNPPPNIHQHCTKTPHPFPAPEYTPEKQPSECHCRLQETSRASHEIEKITDCMLCCAKREGLRFIYITDILTHHSGVCRPGQTAPLEPSISPGDDPVDTHTHTGERSNKIYTQTTAGLFHFWPDQHV